MMTNEFKEDTDGHDDDDDDHDDDNDKDMIVVMLSTALRHILCPPLLLWSASPSARPPA